MDWGRTISISHTRYRIECLLAATREKIRYIVKSHEERVDLEARRTLTFRDPCFIIGYRRSLDPAVRGKFFLRGNLRRNLAGPDDSAAARAPMSLKKLQAQNMEPSCDFGWMVRDPDDINEEEASLTAKRSLALVGKTNYLGYAGPTDPLSQKGDLAKERGMDRGPYGYIKEEGYPPHSLSDTLADLPMWIGAGTGWLIRMGRWGGSWGEEVGGEWREEVGGGGGEVGTGGEEE